MMVAAADVAELEGRGLNVWSVTPATFVEENAEA
jgi:hypothetical protein